MKRVLVLLVVGTLLSGIAAFAASAQTTAPKSAAVKVKLARLDCGATAPLDIDQFSDTRAYIGQKKLLTVSCYLIKHGDQYLLWDAGFPAASKGKPTDPKAPPSPAALTSIIDQLATLSLKPEQISMIGISHYHFDHIGQAASFPAATLLIGKGDFDAVKAGAPRTTKAPIALWIDGTAKSEPVSGDKDVFGDGSVVMLDLPGHTPGHHGLLVRLAGRGTVLLSGDVTHFHENYDSNGIPAFNTNRADSLASLDRFKGLARNLKATVIIQHDPRDVAKLPAFPAWAE